MWDPYGGLHRLDTTLDPPEGSTVQSIDAINDHNQLPLQMLDAATHRTAAPVVQLACAP